MCAGMMPSRNVPVDTRSCEHLGEVTNSVREKTSHQTQSMVKEAAMMLDKGCGRFWIVIDRTGVPLSLARAAAYVSPMIGF